MSVTKCHKADASNVVAVEGSLQEPCSNRQTDMHLVRKLVVTV